MKFEATAIVGSALLSLALGETTQLINNVGQPTCNCSAICTVTGDPHVTDFYGDAWLQEVTEGAELTLYAIPSQNVAVTALIGPNNWVAAISAGTQTFSNSDCSSGKVFSTTLSDMSNGNVSVSASCVKKNGYWHLDTTLTRTESSAKSFEAEEAEIGSTGVCQVGPVSRRRLRGRNLSSTGGKMTCSCSSGCKVIGDPHLTTFYGYTEQMTAGEFDTSTSEPSVVLFHDKSSGFTVTAYVDDAAHADNIYTREVQFGSSKYYAASMCSSTGQIFEYSHSASNGSTLTLQLFCKEVSGSNGFFWNTYLEKVDTSSGKGLQDSTFATIESSDGNTGACYKTTA